MRPKWLIVLLITAAGMLMSCESRQSSEGNKGGQIMPLKVTSGAFTDEAMIPAKYTADGQDLSPPLSWEGVPDGTSSIAIIVDDPDAPMGTWVHWLVWNIPANQAGMSENVSAQELLASGAVQGTTSFNRVGYGGPAPPSGTHRYYFKVYALDGKLNLTAKAKKPDLEKAMKGHVLAQGQIMGRYSRTR